MARWHSKRGASLERFAPLTIASNSSCLRLQMRLLFGGNFFARSTNIATTDSDVVKKIEMELEQNERLSAAKEEKKRQLFAQLIDN